MWLDVYAMRVERRPVLHLRAQPQDTACAVRNSPTRSLAARSRSSHPSDDAGAYAVVVSNADLPRSHHQPKCRREFCPNLRTTLIGQKVLRRCSSRRTSCAGHGACTARGRPSSRRCSSRCSSRACLRILRALMRSTASGLSGKRSRPAYSHQPPASDAITQYMASRANAVSRLREAQCLDHGTIIQGTHVDAKCHAHHSARLRHSGNLPHARRTARRYDGSAR